MTDIIVGLFSHIHGFIDGILPVMGSDGVSNIPLAVTYFVHIIEASDYFFPVSTLFTVIGIMMAYRISMFAWFCINWVIRIIP